ncbi:MAG: RrF2 family transcriptional regulator [Clostridiales bacterium]|nr:RrF2 family transcriptional regulator [Clostridiales bacterium]
MMISTRGRYALRVMIDLGEREGQGFVALREISERQDISEKYLESIVKRLVKNGLVVGIRGKNGGYKLAKKPSEYTVAEILTAAEEVLAPVACLSCGENTCERAESCKTLPMWKELQGVITDFFDGITLQGLISS